MHRTFRQFFVRPSVKIRFLKIYAVWNWMNRRYRLFLLPLRLLPETTWQMSLRTMFPVTMTSHSLGQWMNCWSIIWIRAIPVSSLITSSILTGSCLPNRSLICKLLIVKNCYPMMRLIFRNQIPYRSALATKVRNGLPKVICLLILSRIILKCHLPLQMRYLVISMKNSIQNAILPA